MGEAYKSLAFLLHKCTADKKYILKNKENYLNNTKKTTLKEVIEWRQKIEDFLYTEEYKDHVQRLYLVFVKNNTEIEFYDDIYDLPIENMTGIFKQFIEIVEDLKAAYTLYCTNIRILREKSYDELNREFIMKISEVDEYLNELYNAIKSYCFNNYNHAVISSLIKLKEFPTLKSNFRLMMDIYHKIISSNSDIIKLITADEVDYDIAKKNCNDNPENIYYSNIIEDKVLEHWSVTNINYSNYKKYLNLDCKAILIGNAKDNIDLLFNLKGDYLISNKAYFAALQDLKVYRGKKYCWICGERLGLFSNTVTCKKHIKYEAYL